MVVFDQPSDRAFSGRDIGGHEFEVGRNRLQVGDDLFELDGPIFVVRGSVGLGSVTAELDIKPDLWFFPCHFQGDPVMPGCLGLDALWQLTGFFLGWLGEPGKGRALGVGEVKFTGMVTPKIQKVTYEVDVTRLILRKLKLAVANGIMKADGEIVYQITDMKVGLFAPSAG